MNSHNLIRSGICYVLAVAFAVGCQRESLPSKPAQSTLPTATKVAIGTVRSQLVENSLTFPATIISDETAKLMPRVEAYVERVLVNIGDQVEAGEVLVELTAPELEQRVEQHRATIGKIEAMEKMTHAELKAAQSQLAAMLTDQTLKFSERDRLKRLVETGAIERQRLEEAEAALGTTNAKIENQKNQIELVQAKLLKGEAEMAVEHAMLNESESQVDYLQIKAPFDGIVVRRDVDPGNLVRPNESTDTAPLLTVAKVDRLRAIFYATTDVAEQLAVGQVASFARDDLQEAPVVGEIARTAGAYDDQARMMRVEIDLLNTPDTGTGNRPLRAGTYGSVTVAIQSATLPVVPLSAILQQGETASVVVVRQGISQITPVKIAIKTDTLVGISEGLQAGDSFVLREPASVDLGQTLKQSEMEKENW